MLSMAYAHSANIWHQDAWMLKEKKSDLSFTKKIKKNKCIFKRSDKSCIKICIRRHAFHQTEWTDVANWVKVCPSGCRFVCSLQIPTQALAHMTWYSKLCSPLNTRRTTAQTEQWMSQRKTNKNKLQKFWPRAPPETPLVTEGSFNFFLQSNNNTGQIKSASQNWLSHRASSTVPHQSIFIDHNKLSIFTEQPLSCTSVCS